MRIWILTEERPKIDVVQAILKKLQDDKNIEICFDNLKLLPLFVKSVFQFKYLVEGIDIQTTIMIVEGNNGSFLDHLVFYQDSKPDEDSVPVYVIEETKTTSSESRNVAVYQRLTKFVFVDMFEKMKDSKKIMLYNLRTSYNTIPSTVKFGMRVIKSLEVEVIGYDLADVTDFPKFRNLDDLMVSKNAIATRRTDNVSITINKIDTNTVRITGKLEKSGRLGHDPNIGIITGISKLITLLDPQIKKIIIGNHGLSKNGIGRTNKFLKIANELGIELEGIRIPKTVVDNMYWRYSNSGEKIASIMFHLILEYYNVSVIYENHAGCEQGYFTYPDQSLEPIKKKTSKPDIIFKHKKTIYLIEAEKSENVFKDGMGISQLDKFNSVESEYCSKYEGYSFERYVIGYGDKISQERLDNKKILFQLRTDGTIMFSKYCKEWIKDLIKMSILQQRITILKHDWLCHFLNYF